MRQLVVMIVFAATWLLWSGLYTPLLLVLGALSCAIVFVLARRTGFFDETVYSLHHTPRLVPYWGWLAVEIVKANIAVARIVLSRTPPISPTLVCVDARDLTPVSQVILANSMTLTPASVVLDVEDGQILVHCLTHAAAAEVRSGEMMQRVAKLTGH